MKVRMNESQDNVVESNTKENGMTLFGCGGILFLVIMLFCFWNLIKVPEALSSKSWEPIKAEVVKIYCDSSSSSSTGTSRSKEKCYPMIEYAYTFKNLKYTGNHVLVTGRRGPEFDTQGQALAFLEHKRDKDGKIQIYVNPEDPSDSVVIPGISSGMVKGIILGAIFLIISAALFIVDRVKRKKKENTQ